MSGSKQAVPGVSAWIRLCSQHERLVNSQNPHTHCDLTTVSLAYGAEMKRSVYMDRNNPLRSGVDVVLELAA